MFDLEVFLAAKEAKDLPCLTPLRSELESMFKRVSLLNFQDDPVGLNLRAFAGADAPLVIVSHPATLKYLDMVRPRHTYLSIGIEHGIAPFKQYSYSKGLLSPDFYLAPTLGFAERLRRIYPELRSKIRLGGYPKIEAMKELMAQRSNGSGETPKSIDSENQKILVLLSWGVQEDAYKALPDLECIDYLLHPANAGKLGWFKFERARAHVSNPEVTYPLIASASLVVGDFSSLTLECMHLGKPTTFLIDNGLYASGCDLGDTFMDRDHADFGKIPFTSQRIAKEATLTAEQFMLLSQECQGDLAKWLELTPRTSLDPIHFPLTHGDNRAICASEIRDIVSRYAAEPSSEEERQTAFGVASNITFVREAYLNILGRLPDEKGLRHYMEQLGDPRDEGSEARAVAVTNILAHSAEAKRKRGAEADNDPLGQILELLNKQGQTDSARLPVMLEAMGSRALPSYYRQLRDGATNDDQRVRHGLKLAAGAEVHHDDLVQLAHAYARGEKLEDALYWLGKAIELCPRHGEYMRFKVSLLQRLGRLEDALRCAKEAEAAGAHWGEMATDIERAEDHFISVLREQAASAQEPVALSALVKLARMGKASRKEELGITKRALRLATRVSHAQPA